MATLGVWRQIADFVKSSAKGVTVWLDGTAVRGGEFLSRFNTLPSDFRTLLRPVLFGSEYVGNWRDESTSGDAVCKVSIELNSVQNCAVCETYENRKSAALVAIFGDKQSSFVDHTSVGVEKLHPPEPMVDVLCGTLLKDIQRIALAWDCLPTVYDPRESRPPRDEETVLVNMPDRFQRYGRFERNGRRQVYREIATDRLFYVDNFHVGAAAHLEVFDALENHLGTADLEGNLDSSACVAGRSIKW